jgi:hypothetical protein
MKLEGRTGREKGQGKREEESTEKEQGDLTICGPEVEGQEDY